MSGGHGGESHGKGLGHPCLRKGAVVPFRFWYGGLQGSLVLGCPPWHGRHRDGRMIMSTNPLHQSLPFVFLIPAC